MTTLYVKSYSAKTAISGMSANHSTNMTPSTQLPKPAPVVTLHKPEVSQILITIIIIPNNILLSIYLTLNISKALYILQLHACGTRANSSTVG